jgi:hypothetical protein
MGTGASRPQHGFSVAVTSTQFTVPTWSAVLEHEEEEKAWLGFPPPDMLPEVVAAHKAGRMMAATFTTGLTGLVHPYAIGGPVGLWYCYATEPTVELGASIGVVARQYGFSTVGPPPDLTVEYTLDEEDVLTNLVVTKNQRWFLTAPAPNGKRRMIELRHTDESPMAAVIRMAVVWHVLYASDDANRLLALSEALPYDLDTPAIATTRIEHITRWQFKSSRTRPLFA